MTFEDAIGLAQELVESGAITTAEEWLEFVTEETQ